MRIRVIFCILITMVISACLTTPDYFGNPTNFITYVNPDAPDSYTVRTRKGTMTILGLRSAIFDHKAGYRKLKKTPHDGEVRGNYGDIKYLVTGSYKVMYQKVRYEDSLGGMQKIETWDVVKYYNPRLEIKLTQLRNGKPVTNWVVYYDYRDYGPPMQGDILRIPVVIGNSETIGDKGIFMLASAQRYRIEVSYYMENSLVETWDYSVTPAGGQITSTEPTKSDHGTYEVKTNIQGKEVPIRYFGNIAAVVDQFESSTYESIATYKGETSLQMKPGDTAQFLLGLNRME